MLLHFGHRFLLSLNANTVIACRAKKVGKTPCPHTNSVGDRLDISASPQIAMLTQ
jgi:hypothetical protein